MAAVDVGMRHGQRLADAIARDTGITNERLLSAFASVPRARFLGPPPWCLAKAPLDGRSTPAYEETSDVADVYDNVSVALDRDRDLYNGAPGTVAIWLDALNLQPGERVYHIGCASGYYTAIAAELVGPRGSVIGVDVDEGLVDRANEALADLPNVSLLATDGTTFAPREFDAAFANTGLGAIPAVWLDHGRFAVPLGVPLPGTTLSKAVVFLIDGELAKMIGVAIIYAARGTQRRLMSFDRGNPHDVQSIRRDPHERDAACWLHDETYCLSTRPGGNR